MSFGKKNRMPVKAESPAEAKIKVVFLVNDPYVNNFAPLHTLLKKDKHFDVMTVAIPRVKTGFGDGILTSEMKRFLAGKGIDSIDAQREDGSFLAIETLEPDYVFTTNPYDMYTLPQYGSGHLKKFTRLCHISYAAAMAYYPGWENRFFNNARFLFVTNSDSSLDPESSVPVGCMKLEYICFHNGLRDYLPLRFKKQITIAWKPRWVFEETGFMKYAPVLLNLLEQNKKLRLILVVHPYLEAMLSQNGQRHAYDLFLARAQKSDRFSLVEGEDFLTQVMCADIMVAEPSSTLAEFARTGRPMILTGQGHTYTQMGERLRKACYSATQGSELQEILAELLQGKDRLRKFRWKNRKNYFFNPPCWKKVSGCIRDKLLQDVQQNGSGYQKETMANMFKKGDTVILNGSGAGDCYGGGGRTPIWKDSCMQIVEVVEDMPFEYGLSVYGQSELVGWFQQKDLKSYNKEVEDSPG